MDLLTLASALSIGLLAGVELAVGAALGPILNGLGDATLEARTRGATELGRVMPLAYGVVLVLAGLTLLTAPEDARPWLFAAMAVFIAARALTVGFLVPINVRVGRWDPQRPPSDWRSQLRRWDRGHTARIVLLVATFALTLLALPAALA